LLKGLTTGADAQDLSQTLWDLHPENNTFPGEVFLGIGAKTLNLAWAGPDHTIEYDGLIPRFLPGCQFRGRDAGCGLRRRRELGV
jgi:hypothetical protein